MRSWPLGLWTTLMVSCSSAQSPLISIKSSTNVIPEQTNCELGLIERDTFVRLIPENAYRSPVNLKIPDSFFDYDFILKAKPDCVSAEPEPDIELSSPLVLYVDESTGGPVGYNRNHNERVPLIISANESPALSRIKTLASDIQSAAEGSMDGPIILQYSDTHFLYVDSNEWDQTYYVDCFGTIINPRHCDLYVTIDPPLDIKMGDIEFIKDDIDTQAYGLHLIRVFVQAE